MNSECLLYLMIRAAAGGGSFKRAGREYSVESIQYGDRFAQLEEMRGF